MKWFVLLLTLVLFLSLQFVFAVDVDEKGKDHSGRQAVVVKTAQYEVHWKKEQQMGYSGAFWGDSKDSIIEGGQGRNLYHSSNYAGWKDWGALTDVKVLEKGGGKAVVQYESFDGQNKEYICVATYYDNANWIKHEVTVKAKGADVTSFESGHEPMFEPRSPLVKGFKKWTAPYPHVAYWTDVGHFAALYGEKATDSRDFPAWAPNGRMDLVHDGLGQKVKKGEESEPIVYYVAFGEGKSAEANALAEEVLKEVKPGAVSSYRKLSTTWGEIKSSH